MLPSPFFPYSAHCSFWQQNAESGSAWFLTMARLLLGVPQFRVRHHTKLCPLGEARRQDGKMEVSSNYNFANIE
jgi:hypothetical protein